MREIRTAQYTHSLCGIRSDTVDERQHSNTTEPASNKLILWDLGNNRFNLAVFCVMTGTLIVLSSLRSLSFFAVLINSAKRLHDGMLKACMNTRLRFFEINPSGKLPYIMQLFLLQTTGINSQNGFSGRILNRFAKDIGQVDDYLPTTIHDFLQCFFLVLSTGVVTIVSSYWVIIPVVPLLVIFYIYRQYYLCASRDLKRIESVARSPMFSWVNVTIQGLPCIRAAGIQPYQLQTFDELVDKHTSVFYANIAAARWLSIRLDLLCWIFITAVVAICLLLGTFSTIAGSSVGLMITYATGLVGLFQWCVRQSAEVENQMVSVERTVEYMDLEPEFTQPPVIVPPEGWPKHGKIVFDRLWLRYQTGDTWALKDITLEVRPGLKVGIVGRTGAGKSSLISAIFRLVEAEQGKLLVDDVDVARLELKELRKRISIIPQDPIMFAGTIRNNLDPEHQLSSVAIWNALNSVQLNKVISNNPDGLDTRISEGGSNFSTGQRQLLALARAILGGNQILVVDEATANVDPETDAIIQKALRSQFARCTVLTVAHRLQTVIDNDLLVVMDRGRIVEQGEPHFLLNPNLAEQDRSLVGSRQIPAVNALDNQFEAVTGHGPLANLVRQTGPEESRLLAKLAREAYLKMLNRDL
ncbi:ATP-binding cassette, subfamily C (CFTR/MRP), member 4 [Paragonimus westermani]|uniref:ATP-binding cassette, subfamily C (CFTR/MRP), member 4 n=1 Tax=Paragonimus westermani TaxID=34504 RepID=A0A5J4P3M2_9TREM|nr:ATP-binding cassette, subfamily C (CFTR/MRP), member 4 [Paragonimus westermani]